MRSEVIENLNREFYAVPAGTLAPYYYRYLGYAEDMNARPPMFRANAIYSLFTKTTPVILTSLLREDMPYAPISLAIALCFTAWRRTAR